MTNKLEHCNISNNVYFLHLWATCFNLYTGHLQALLNMWTLFCLTYQCSNLIVLAKHIVMYSIKVWIWVGVIHEFLALFSATHFTIEGKTMHCDISKTKHTIRSYVHYKHGGIHRGFLYDNIEIHVFMKYFIKKLTNIKNPLWYCLKLH